MKNGLYLLVCLSLMFSACGDDEPSISNDEMLSTYITDNNLDATKHESGVYYVIEEEGTGTEHPTVNSQIHIEYKGYFTDGEVFDEGTLGPNPPAFLSGFIEGWKIGIPFFKKGGEGILLIPSDLAYGPSGRGSIPPNTPLVFDIKLIDFE